MTPVEVITPVPPGTGAEGQEQVGEAHTNENGAVFTTGARKSLELGRNSVSLSWVLSLTAVLGCMGTRLPGL